MITVDGRVVVMDFGLARDATRSSNGRGTTLRSGDSAVANSREHDGADNPLASPQPALTRTGDILGTPAYMAPEQMSGEAAEATCDQWALCVSLYEALWGRRPHDSRTVTGLLTSALDGPPHPPRSEVPRRIRAALRRGLDPRPERRFASMAELIAQLRPQPSRLRRGAPLLLVAGFGVGVWSMQPTVAEPTPCSSASATFAEIWSPGHAEALDAAFAGTAVPAGRTVAKRVASTLDAYAESWSGQHKQACESAPDDLDKRMRCLSRRRSEVEQLVGVLVSADATAVEQAQAAVDGLTDPKRCSLPAYLDAQSEPPSDSTTLAEVKHAERALAEIEALGHTGNMAAALAKAEELASTVPSLRYRPMAAEILFTQGDLLFGAGDARRAEGILEAAYLEAHAASARDTASKAALTLASIYATLIGDPGKGEHWRRIAKAELGDAPPLSFRAALLEIEAEANLRSGKLDEGLELSRQRLSLLQRGCPDCAATAMAHLTIAELYLTFARGDDALRHARQGVALAKKLHPGPHETVATALFTLGDVLYNLDRADEAVATWEQVLAIRQAVLGPDSANLSMSRAAYGSALVEVGRIDEGIGHIETARDKLLTIVDGTTIAVVHNRLGTAYAAAGRRDDARAAYQAGVDTYDAEYPDGHPTGAILLMNLAGQTPDAATALPVYERALAMRRATVDGADPQQSLLLHQIASAEATLKRTNDAIAHYRESIALDHDDALTNSRLGARLALADLLWAEQPADALDVIDAAARRCDDLAPAQRAAADCDRVAQWRKDHGN